MFMQKITIRCQSVQNHGNGMVTLGLLSEPISEADSKTIQRLFPHTTEQVYDLHRVEVMLDSITHDPVKWESGHEDSTIIGRSVADLIYEADRPS